MAIEVVRLTGLCSGGRCTVSLLWRQNANTFSDNEEVICEWETSTFRQTRKTVKYYFPDKPSGHFDSFQVDTTGRENVILNSQILNRFSRRGSEEQLSDTFKKRIKV